MIKIQHSRFEFVLIVRQSSSYPFFCHYSSCVSFVWVVQVTRDVKPAARTVEGNWLPKEHVYTKISWGSGNLSKVQSNLEHLALNLLSRLVMPTWPRIFLILLVSRTCKSKRFGFESPSFGSALVIETAPRSGGYVLGFRIDPETRLQVKFAAKQTASSARNLILVELRQESPLTEKLKQHRVQWWRRGSSIVITCRMSFLPIMLPRTRTKGGALSPFGTSPLKVLTEKSWRFHN
jgi:hypothetical protein